MSGFGDFEPDDAFDTEPADPEQVARRIHDHLLRARRERVRWDDLTAGERQLLVEIAQDVLDWLRRQGAL